MVRVVTMVTGDVSSSCHLCLTVKLLHFDSVTKENRIHLRGFYSVYVGPLKINIRVGLLMTAVRTRIRLFTTIINHLPCFYFHLKMPTGSLKAIYGNYKPISLLFST